MKLKHKFNAKRVTVDEIKFASKREAKRYLELKTLQNANEVLFFLRQVPFHLPAHIKYLLDFMVFWKNGDITFEDAKGMKTAIYILKKKQVEELYKISITEI